MQISVRRAGALLASIVSVAVAGVIGAGVITQQNDPVDQQTLVGKKAPDFTLTDITGKEHKLSDYTSDGKVVVLEWFNAECPFVVKHYKADPSTMNKLSNDFAERGVVWLAINSGHDGNSSADLEMNTRIHKEWNLQFPILRDLDGRVGRAYGAVTTPNMYIIDKDGVLRYAGAIDNDSRAGKPGDVNHVRNALNSLLNGETIDVAYVRPYGCSVKYGKN